MNRTLLLSVCLSAVVLGILPVGTASGEINIIPAFENTKSESPPFDPTGALLRALFDEAELRYEEIIMDTHPLTIF